jgi:predicted dienelactone hydrolase
MTRQRQPGKLDSMRSCMLLGLACLFLAFPVRGEAQSALPGDAPSKVGVTTRHVFPQEPYEWRGAGSHALLEVVWYPADSAAEPKPQLVPPVGTAIFQAAPAAPEAHIGASPAKFPLILLSHGTGGTAQSMAWFATALAARGYIVAAVNHPGNNAIDPHTVQGFTLWWQRASDLSAVLNDILTDPQFGPRVDRARIGAAGFSLGGTTMMELAGGRASPTHFADTCRAKPAQATCKAPPEFPDLLVKSAALTDADPAYAKALRKAGASFHERRVRAIFAMAPAIAPGFAPASLAKIAIPVAIVAGAEDSIVPVDANAQYYAAQIPGAALTIFPGAVDHYTFLDECTPEGRSAMAQICVDKPGVDRAAIHNQTIDLAAKFFATNLR